MKYLKSCYLLVCFIFVLACQNDSTSSTSVPKASVSQEIKPTKTNVETVPVTPTQMPLLPKSEKIQSGKLNPVDEGQLSPDFQRFRVELLGAIDRKDVDFIKQMIAEDIKLGFGGESGEQAFMEIWKLESADSRFWQTLKKILLLGGTFDRSNKNGFRIPYLFGKSLGLEPFDYAVITGEKVRIRKEPSQTGEIIAALTYDVVRLRAIIEGSDDSIEGEIWPWVKIEMPDNSGTGYVYGRYIHSPVDYRAYFERINGQWKMLFFLAGD